MQAAQGVSWARAAAQAGGAPSLEIARVQRGCTVCLSTDELPDKPPCSRSEVGAREVMEREISHAPGHGQVRWRRIEQATPRRERLEMPDTEQVAQVHVKVRHPVCLHQGVCRGWAGS